MPGSGVRPALMRVLRCRTPPSGWYTFRMSSAVFILGAGASAQSGCPCMYDFFDRAQTLFATGALGEFEADFQRVQAFRSKLQRSFAKADIDIFGLESVFNAIEMAITLGLEDDATRASFVRLIGGVLERTQLHTVTRNLNPNSNGISMRLAGPAGYTQLAGLIRRLLLNKHYSSLSFVTFNYDLGLEIALHGVGIPFSYHLDVNDKVPDGGVGVFKLHGSLNWHQVSKRDGVQYVPVEWIVSQAHALWDSTQTGNLSTPLMLSEVYRRHSRIDMELGDAFIVPPSENKAASRKILQPVWKAACLAIADADVISAIGFSIPATDQFFKLFYALGSVSDKILQGFYVVDKSDMVRSRYESLLGGHARHRLQVEVSDFVQGIRFLTEKLK